MASMADDDEHSPPERPAAAFATTRWTIVAEAARSHSPEAENAMEALAIGYWYPLYAFLRRRGMRPQDAEDLTQEFFSRRILTKQIFKGTDPARGKFRSWLLTSLQNFLHNEREKDNAQKRGGGATHLSLDFHDGEQRYLAEPSHDLTPEKIYDRAWALTQLQDAHRALGDRYESGGRGELFHELKRFLPGADDAPPHAEVAARIGKSESAIKMAVSRMRKEFGATLREIVGRTVSDPGQLDEEMRDLLRALGG